MKQRTLTVVSAGMSQPSSTRLLTDQLATATGDELDRLGVRVDTQVIELRDHGHDLVNHLLTGFASARLKQVIDTVGGADGLIAVTPIFNASYSGLFKLFFDVVGDASIVDKPTLIAATGGTARHSLALEHAVRPMFTYLRAVVVPTSVFAASEDWAGATAAEGGVAPSARAEGALRSRIQRAGRELAELMDRRDTTTVADPFALSTTFERLLAGD
jgi:FMN reductase